ncbi:MAG: hypothetical protein ACYTXY_28765 [Nostoc sp.]
MSRCSDSEIILHDYSNSSLTEALGIHSSNLSGAITTGFERKWSKIGQDKDMILKNQSR